VPTKIRDALSSVIRSAVSADYLIKTPLDGLRSPTVHYGPTSRFFEVQRSGCNRRQTIEKIGGASRDRTDGLVVANDALSQLSYSPLRLGFRFLFYQPYSLSPRRGAQKGIFFQESLRPRFRFYTLLSIHLSIRPTCRLLSSALQLVSPYAKSEHPIVFRTLGKAVRVGNRGL
jgi:hypothetical protein